MSYRYSKRIEKIQITNKKKQHECVMMIIIIRIIIMKM